MIPDYMLKFRFVFNKSIYIETKNIFSLIGFYKLVSIKKYNKKNVMHS